MNVASYCIFGERDLYWDCVPAVVRAHHNLFPGWEMWVHHDTTIDRKGYLLKRYAQHGLLRLIPCGENKLIGVSALWRFKPIWQAGVDYMLSRDMDSLPLPKDRRMVEVFMQSGKAAHSVTDNPSHMGSSQFMAGMCAFHVPRTRQLLPIPTWEDFVSLGKDMGTWRGGPDQVLLGRVLFAAVGNYICFHLLGTNYTGPWVFNKIEATPLPDVPEYVQQEGDKLMPFMGCPGFDIGRAVAFFDQHGDPVVTARIHAAEAYPFP